ncbi:MAG: hypothetical protein IJL67_10650 [Oscillospiraceae bacterium]|nr:hypothetical protein [Oscillospiraceae bacterium]
MDYNELLITAAKKYQELTTYDYTIITGQKRKLDKKRILITEVSNRQRQKKVSVIAGDN